MSTSKTLFGLLVIILLQVAACQSPKPVRVGFVAGLTGSNAALGVDGRDGALLAADEVNAAGGINGRPVELVIRDDLGTNEGALAADDDLINREKIDFIIGHMISSTMMASWEKFKDSGAIFVSPTVATPQLAGMDDNFFRLIPINSFVAEQLAVYAIRELGLKKVAVLYDSENAAFTETYQRGFSDAFIANGGEIVFTYAFSSKSGADLKPVLREIKGSNPDGLFISASAFDTALIAQQARLAGLDKEQLLATNWALTGDLRETGGGAIDGLVAVVTHDENSQEPVHLEFEKRFIERFGREPTFAAGYGYESVKVLAHALKKTNGERQGLKEALLKTKGFPGVNGNISFNEYGDVSRTLYLVTVQDGKFITTRTFPAR